MKTSKKPSIIARTLTATDLAAAIGGVENSQERTNGNGAERHPDGGGGGPTPEEIRTRQN